MCGSAIVRFGSNGLPEPRHLLAHGDLAASQSAPAPAPASEPDPWSQVIDRWGLTPCEARALRDIYAGEKFDAIGRKHRCTTHAIDAHWRSVQSKMHVKGRVHVQQAIADFLADLKQQEAVRQAVEKAVTEATEPLLKENAQLRQQLADAITLSPADPPPPKPRVVGRKGRR